MALGKLSISNENMGIFEKEAGGGNTMTSHFLWVVLICVRNDFYNICGNCEKL